MTVNVSSLSNIYILRKHDQTLTQCKPRWKKCIKCTKQILLSSKQTVQPTRWSLVAHLRRDHKSPLSTHTQPLRQGSKVDSQLVHVNGSTHLINSCPSASWSSDSFLTPCQWSHSAHSQPANNFIPHYQSLSDLTPFPQLYTALTHNMCIPLLWCQENPRSCLSRHGRCRWQSWGPTFCKLNDTLVIFCSLPLVDVLAWNVSLASRLVLWGQATESFPRN